MIEKPISNFEARIYKLTIKRDKRRYGRTERLRVRSRRKRRYEGWPELD
jgi:hypothetical protein